MLGVRPEDLYLVEASDGAYPGSIDATVDVIEPLGDSLLLECTVGEDVIRANANPRADVDHGDALELRYDPERLHVFDADSGRALYHSATTDEAPVMHAGD